MFALQVAALAWLWPAVLSVPDWPVGPVTPGALLKAGLLVTPLVLLGLAVLLRARGEGPAAVGLSGMAGRWRRALLVGLAGGLVLWLPGAWLAGLLDGWGWGGPEGVFLVEGAGGVLVATLGAALLGGVCEELVFRGFLLTRLEGLLMDPARPERSFWLAALLSALWFGAGHGYQGPSALVVTTLWGLGLALLLRLCKRRLVPVMVAHTTLDLLGFLVLAS